MSVMSIIPGLRHTQKALDTFRNIIEVRINRTENLISTLLNALNYRNVNCVDNRVKPYEDASEAAIEENLRMLIEHQTSYLNELYDAIARLNAGTYGVCIKTGQLIPEARLMVVPHTKYSIEAKLPDPNLPRSYYKPLKKRRSSIRSRGKDRKSSGLDTEVM